MLEALGGRKVAIGIGLVAVGVAVEFLGPRGLTETMSYFLMGMGLGYFAANVGSKASEAVKSVASARKAQPAKQDRVDLTPVMAMLEEQKRVIESVSQGSSAKEMENVKTSINAVVNQNALIAKAMGEVGAKMQYIVDLAQGNKG